MDLLAAAVASTAFVAALTGIRWLATAPPKPRARRGNEDAWWRVAGRWLVGIPVLAVVFILGLAGMVIAGGLLFTVVLAAGAVVLAAALSPFGIVIGLSAAAIMGWTWLSRRG